MLQSWGQFIRSPEAAMYPVATALFLPIVFILAGALVWIVFEFGRFTIEMLRRDRKRSLARIEYAAGTARAFVRGGQRADAVAELAKMSTNWLIAKFIVLLGDGSDLSRPKLLKVVVDTEGIAARRLDATRVWIRLGPIIGLITTLIPISPALVALAKGDLETLSANLIVAFSTTVISLLVAGLAFVISVFRERAYTQDVSDIEYALELMEE